MSKLDKAIARLKEKPKDYSWVEAKALLSKLGFIEIQGDGSRVKFFHKERDLVVMLHCPHPGNTLKMYAVKIIYNRLSEGGFI